VNTEYSVLSWRTSEGSAGADGSSFAWVLGAARFSEGSCRD